MTIEENNISLDLTIKAVSLSNKISPNGSFLAVNDAGFENWIKVVPPANVNYIKKGKAIIKLNEEGDAVYVHMTEVSPEQPKKPYQNNWGKPRENTFFKKAPSPSGNEFNNASQYNSIQSKGYDLVPNQVIMEGLTLDEYESELNKINKVAVGIVSSQLFKVEKADMSEKELNKIMPNGDATKQKRLYDCAIYFKIKQKEEEVQDY